MLYLPDAWALPHVWGLPISPVLLRDSLSPAVDLPGLHFPQPPLYFGEQVTKFNQSDGLVKGLWFKLGIQNTRITLSSLVGASWTVVTVTVLSVTMDTWLLLICLRSGPGHILPNSWWGLNITSLCVCSYSDAYVACDDQQRTVR